MNDKKRPTEIGGVTSAGLVDFSCRVSVRIWDSFQN